MSLSKLILWFNDVQYLIKYAENASSAHPDQTAPQDQGLQCLLKVFMLFRYFET